jgi:DNA-binding Xre family transcriptional regulator
MGILHIMIFMAKKNQLTIRMNLRNLMDARGLNVDKLVDLCKEAGAPITRTTVYNMLDPNARGVYLSSIAALCNGLQIHPGDLFVIEEGK